VNAISPSEPLLNKSSKRYSKANLAWKGLYIHISDVLPLHCGCDLAGCRDISDVLPLHCGCDLAGCRDISDVLPLHCGCDLAGCREVQYAFMDTTIS
jgi:hypothetical protein